MGWYGHGEDGLVGLFDYYYINTHYTFHDFDYDSTDFDLRRPHLHYLKLFIKKQEAKKEEILILMSDSGEASPEFGDS